MKRYILSLTIGMISFLNGFSAQTGDAFKGVWPVNDKALIKSLNGEWQLKVVKGVTDDKTVPAADDTWGKIPVPGCWEAYGFCEPKYDYPDSLTGYYRNSFTVPAEWKGQQIIIRLDGVLRGYDLWLNGQYVGSWKSGYNTCQFDLTPYLTKKAFKGEAQQLAMRVYSQFKGYEFDCFDDWATMGIFRDVTLMAVPTIHLSDLTVTTKMNGEVTVKTEVANATSKTTTDYEIMDAQGQVVSTGGKIANPHLWTAETPYLYTLRVYVREKGKTLQTFTQKIGIREISIEGNLLKLNGQPIKLRGVNAHSTDPKTVKVISDELTLKDMRMMKEASVNYMRLSHYPREPRFFELADSLGFYLVDEVPFGFGDKHLSNRKYQDILKTRALATVTRDKNHPSVLVWSVGNENPLPQTCVEVGDYVGQLDPSRPYCFPQVGSYFRKFWEKAGMQPSETGPSPFPSQAPVYAPHYPTTGQIGGFYQHLDRPVIFTEYCHTLGISFEDHDRQWEIIERTPGIAGGSVWEWADQGMPFRGKKDDVRGRMFGYEEKVYTSKDGGFEMYGNKGTDGLLYADRTPLPNYYELQHNYARAFVRSVSCGSLAANLEIVNRYDFLNLKDEVDFHWVLTLDRDTVNQGTFRPDCPPRATIPYHFPLPLIPNEVIVSSHYVLHFTLTDVEGHTFLRQSFVLNKPQIEWTGHGSGAVMAQETTIRTGRKPTMAERITQKDRLSQKYLLPLDNEQVKADIVSKCIEGGEEITFTLTPDTADVFRSELGLAYLLDKSIDRVQWIGYGPFASYPGRYQANRYGFWAKHMDDLYFEGNHGGIDAAFLSDKDGNGILIVGDSLNLNFEQTDRGIVLTVNAAVSGQGPKFSKTHFPGWKKGDAPVSATFRSYYIKANVMPQVLKRFFSPTTVPAPYKPFLTQYDTYLQKYDDIKLSKERSLNILFIGNSITYGALHEHREVTAPPAQCARWLSAQEDIDSVFFRNCGRSGRTTYHFLPNPEDVIPAGDKTYFSDVVAKTRELVKQHPGLPLWFSIMLGTNDSVERKHNSHTTPDNYVNNLVAIIDSLLTLWPDAHVALNKPIWYTPDYVTPGGSVASKQSQKLIGIYADRFSDVISRCKSGHVHLGDSDAYNYFKKHWKTDINEEKDSRGKSYWLHPNEQGAAKLAEYWGKAILKNLK